MFLIKIVLFFVLIKNIRQVTGTIVADAADALDASISVAEDNSDCTIVATSRVYDPEAENIFGRGYFSFQVHISQHVNITSNHFLWLEKVSSIVEEGFSVRTGGQSQFRSHLKENLLFETVLAVELRSGLAPPDQPPTSHPSVEPTFVQSESPTSFPTGIPTSPSSGIPTTRPTKVDSSMPTLFPTEHLSSTPSKVPSFAPSKRRTNAPTKISSNGLSIAPTTKPSSSPSNRSASNTVPMNDPTPTEPSKVNLDNISTPTSNSVGSKKKNSSSPRYDPAVLAAIVGGSVTIVLSCILISCIWWRKKDQKAKQRIKPKVPLKAHDGQRDRNTDDFIGAMVELDQQSLAETTLGDQTAGRNRPKTRNSTQAIRPVDSFADSFEESSLYTTPFSLKLEEGSYRLTLPTSHSPFSSQLAKPLDYEGNILFPLSDTNTESSDGMYSSGHSSGRADEGPIDLDTEQLYERRGPGPIDLDTQKPFKPGFANGASSRQDDDEFQIDRLSQTTDDFDLSPYELDAWSYDYEEFDKGSEYYDDEARSKALSQSAKSTKNLRSVLENFAAPEENSQYSTATSEEEKEEVKEEPAEFNDSQMDQEQTGKKLNEAMRTQSVESSKADADLTIDRQSREKQPTSPSSVSSKRSLSSFSSWGSRKTQSGQPPLYPSSENKREKGGTLSVESTYQSPLRRWLESVEEVPNMYVSPTTPSHTTSHTIPIVTPEGGESESDEEQSSDARPSQRVGIDLIAGQPRDDDAASASSTSTGMSPSPWLFDTVEQTLGPRSVTADMESISGKSNLSARSPGNRSSRLSSTGAESEVSFGSRLSYRSGLAQSEASFTPQDLEHTIKRLEMQLAALDSDAMTTSSVGASSFSTVSTRNRAPKVSRKKRIIVVVPKGKLGVILANRHDGNGTVVSEVREHSSLKGMLSPGDRLVAVDGEDVTGMLVSQITSLMASKADQERRLTVITSIPQQYSISREHECSLQLKKDYSIIN